jgi:hypothetical protein
MGFRGGIRGEEVLALISHGVKSKLAVVFNDGTLPGIVVSMEGRKN